MPGRAPNKEYRPIKFNILMNVLKTCFSSYFLLKMQDWISGPDVFTKVFFPVLFNICRIFMISCLFSVQESTENVCRAS